MDPQSVVELWWIAPAVVGAGAATVMVARHNGRRRRLAFDAARKELAAAQKESSARSAAARMARADVTRVTAERAAGRADDAVVAQARRVLRDAEQRSKAAGALVRARRAQVSAARIALSTPGDPVERLNAEHDAVLARWMEYETDPARLIAYPQMSDGRSPANAAFLTAVERARDARLDPADKKISPESFGAYRDAVTALERAFAEAERAAGAAADPRPAWQDAAQSVLERSVEALRNATETWGRRRRDGA